MSKRHSLLQPVLTNRRGEKADKKSWHQLLGSSSSVAIYQAALQAEQPLLLVTHDTPSALRYEQEDRKSTRLNSSH